MLPRVRRRRGAQWLIKRHDMACVDEAVSLGSDKTAEVWLSSSARAHWCKRGRREWRGRGEAEKGESRARLLVGVLPGPVIARRVGRVGSLVTWRVGEVTGRLDGASRCSSVAGLARRLVVGDVQRDLVLTHQGQNAFRGLDVGEERIELAQVALAHDRIALELGVIRDQEDLA